MTSSKTDQVLQGTLTHYGVKGMKWDESKKGKRGKKDLRGIPTSGTVGDVIDKYVENDGSTKQPSAYGARDLRSDADRFIGRIVDRENQKDPNFAKPRFKSDITTKELIERSEERKRERRRRENKKKHEQRGLTQSSLSEDSIDDTLKHYGVKGMKWGVRKDKRGAVKSVVRRAPLQGSNEFDGPNADGKAQLIKAVTGSDTLPRLKKTYSTARKPINRALRSLNKSEEYKNKDLTNPKSKVYKDYHKEVSKLVVEKLNASTALNLRPKDRFLIDSYRYDSRTGKRPEIGMVTDEKTDAARSPGAQRAAKNILNRHNTFLNDVADSTRSNAAIYGAGYLALALGQPAVTSAAIFTGDVKTYSEIYRRRKAKKETNQFLSDHGVKHADEDMSDRPDVDIVISYGVTDLGHIEEVTLDVTPKGEADLEHSEITFGEILQHNELYSANGSIDDYLMHYGVKGMKWGVRKDRGSSGKRKTTSAKSKSKSTDSELKDKVRSIASSVKKSLSAEGINKRRVDRVKAKTKKTEAKAARAEEVRKAKEQLTAAKDRKNLAEGKPTSSDKKPTPTKTKTVTSKATGTAGLTNDELKAKVERMELERRYAAATSSSKSSGVVATFAKGAGGKLSARLQAEVANRVFQAVLGGKDAPKAKTKLADVPAPKVAEHVKNITDTAKKNPASTPPVTAMAMGLVGAASMAASAANKNRSSQKATFGPRPSGFTDSFSDEIIDGFMNIKNTQYKTARDFNREIELYRRR